MRKALPILIILAVIVGIGGCGYNGMNRARLEADNAWAEVQSSYQRRADLIPNLVEVVKGAAKFEKETYTGVAVARAGGDATSAANNLKNAVNSSQGSPTEAQMQQIQQSSAQAQNAARNFINISVEAYPQLRATENFLGLQNQLEGTENRINTSRNSYNNKVKDYNVKVSSFPGNLLAGMFGFKQRAMFQADAEAQKVPKIQPM